MSAKAEKPPSEFQQIKAKFAAAAAAQATELADKRAKDKQVALRNKIARRDFTYSHGLLVVLLLSFVYLHSVGIYLFTKGFLLTRLVLEHKSSCAISPLQVYGDAALPNVDNGCWHPRTFTKAVVVIIDALRYDFTVPYVPVDNTSSPHHYHNTFTTPYRIASKNPENAVLLPFIADPPTTTLQRLKGLTTGTLPTFIDAGSNFAGTAIDEDNIISQLKSLGKRMAFMGDDTWMALFPGLFEEEMNHPYESLNVWDLHTVDNGVNEHIFPLLERKNATKWDVLFAHYLGVDHAGHRYGPDHFAMTEKLQQMDDVVQRLVDSIDDQTLLVVMGDHGMDSKGDHGGESQGEVEAALWMYSKKPVFGRLPKELLPQDEVRSVAQIDLVPTLSLLLGIPIPFNNLGAPIAEAFLGKRGEEGMKNLATVSRLTSAQIKRYQREYTGTKDEDIEVDALVKTSWEAGQKKWEGLQGKWAKKAPGAWAQVYSDFSSFQRETLRICKYLWARFDLVSMGAGVVVILSSILTLAIYARALKGDIIQLTGFYLGWIRTGLAAGTILSLPAAYGFAEKLEVPRLHIVLFGTAMGIVLGLLGASMVVRQRLASVLPKSGWGVLSLLFAILNSVMFGSNSFTIWEDKIITYFIATFAVCSFISSLRRKDTRTIMMGAYHSIMLLILTRVASFSRLCREEQIPYCQSTFYVSESSSVSASWTLGLLFAMALTLPAFLGDFYSGTSSYHGPAQFYIGWAFRFGLLLVAAFWTLDSADNGSWYPQYDALIKGSKPVIAQLVLAIALIAGNVGFAWSSLCLDVEVKQTNGNSNASSKPGNQVTSVGGRTVTILGYANVHGSRYFLLVLSWALALILLQKPMGALSLGILLYQILTVVEIVDINNLSSSSIGPVILALLGNAHFFSTGHQATLSSIQWESAFIPLTTIRYPWSPLLVAGNTLGPQILTAMAVPLIALWKAPAKRDIKEIESLLSRVGRAAATYILFQATIAGASMMCAGWLRRHLMLYRIFSPRFMLGAVTLLVTECVCVLMGVGAVRWNWTAVAGVFGYV
jgi:phosphatidylinositol glycan class O